MNSLPASSSSPFSQPARSFSPPVAATPATRQWARRSTARPTRWRLSTERAADKTAAVIDDATITTKVKAAVLAEPGLKTLQINVDTKDGRVTLAGTVDNAELKQRATQVAQSVEGVKSVSDQLTVKSS